MFLFQLRAQKNNKILKDFKITDRYKKWTGITEDRNVE